MILITGKNINLQENGSLKLLVSLLILFLLSLNSVAQDIHFSQFFSAPLITNPANTGMSGNNLRVANNYRNQWSGIGIPYRTLAIAVDKKLSGFHKNIGIGAYFLHDQSSSFRLSNENVRTGNEILYFVSDRPGGKGGSDIWYTEYNSRTNTYKQPQDLDKGVNTAGEECCPFYDFTTQTLYFSSKGRKTGWGGFDIFKTTGSTKRWTEAIPLPKPVNSSYDDYYFSIFKNNKEGFFSSNRPGSMTLGNGNCCDDIFTFKINHCALINAVGTVRNSVNDDVYETLREKYQLEMEYPKDSSVLANIPVELYLSDASDEDEILISKTVTDHSGNFHFGLERDKNYKVLIKNYGYFEKKVAISTLNRNCADTFHIGTTLISYLPKVNVKINIYYDHDNFKLSSTALQTIDTTLMHLLDLFPNAIVEIGSHTDSTGTGAYNIKLSQRRSESVVNYLILKGINKERLIAKGYGMQLPIAPNTNSDGIVNEAGMQLNRRTEIKIVGEISSFCPDEE